MHSTTTDYRSYGDMVALVNPDGSPVPDHEKYTETCEPDSAEDWGPWADAWRFELSPEDGPDAPDDPAFYGPTRLQALGIAPISGGSPLEEPYPLPTPQDLHDHDLEAWLAGLDRSGDFPRRKGRDDRAEDMAEVREWFAGHPGA